VLSLFPFPVSTLHVMSNHLHRAVIQWEQPAVEFLKGKYSRDHTWTFDGGAVISASAAPSVVPAPWTNAAFIDPEEAMVGSLSSCHMLSFLHIASRHGFQVASYRDEATGMMGKTERGIPWVAAVTLHPAVTYSGEKRPSGEEEAHLHHLAHEQCFIANSVKTEITVSPVAAS
jgi:organic hydroperoxide reductase OsmC/OhrA